jgi:hypothetical protein
MTIKKDNVLSDMLGHVSLCDTAILTPGSAVWIMPFTMEDMQIGVSSNLQVETSVKDNIGTKQCDYNTVVVGTVEEPVLGTGQQGKLRCEVADASTQPCQASIVKSKIRGVYMLKHVKYHPQNSPVDFFSNQ